MPGGQLGASTMDAHGDYLHPKSGRLHLVHNAHSQRPPAEPKN